VGQVWSKADIDGTSQTGHHGGTGSVLAVTSQNLGIDKRLGTPDDMLAPLNAKPVWVSVDNAAGSNCEDTSDTIRNFTSFHSEGGYFVYGDGSVHFIANTIEPATYQALSTIAGKEVVSTE